MIVKMENLPFLSNDVPSPSRNAPPRGNDEWVDPPPERTFSMQSRGGNDPLEILKGVNPIGLILIGIVIGVMVVSMRPIVVQSK